MATLNLGSVTTNNAQIAAAVQTVLANYEGADYGEKGHDYFLKKMMVDVNNLLKGEHVESFVPFTDLEQI